MVILENIDIDKAILQNIDIDKMSNRFKFGISNRAREGGGIIGNAWKVVFLFGLEFLPLCPFKRICSKRCHFIINKWSS